MTEKNQLQTIIESSQVDKTTAEKALASFGAMFAQAAEYERLAKSIVVNDVTEVDKMAQAKKLRLEIRKIRTGSKETHDELKKNSLAEGKMIDAVHNTILALTTPLENHLEAQEKFKERKEAEAKAALLTKRMEITKAAGLQSDGSWPKLEDMSEEQFNAFYQVQLDMKVTAARLEQERIARVKAQEEADAKMRAENARLQQEATENARKLREAEAATKRQAELVAEETRKRQAAETAATELKAKAAQIDASIQPGFKFTGPEIAVIEAQNNRESGVRARDPKNSEKDHDREIFLGFVRSFHEEKQWLQGMRTDEGRKLATLCEGLLDKIEKFVMENPFMK